MHTSNAQPNSKSDDPLWVFLAELPLRDFLSDHDRREGPTAGRLFQTVPELGLSPEYTEHIARSLAGFAGDALARAKQGRLEIPGRIRIFCQKKMIGDANSAKASRPYHADRAQEHLQVLPYPGASVVGGWGFFMIERGEELPPHSSAIPHNYIDLYLYKEGE